MGETAKTAGIFINLYICTVDLLVYMDTGYITNANVVFFKNKNKIINATNF